jgi:class 3 adenylate cyclase
MHRELKDLLHEATGSSGFVVAIFLDVRGFSSFAKLAESSEAAVFLRRMYISILDDYFPQADFFKPTGDGLMIILSYTAEDIAEVVNAAVATSLRIVESFTDLCADDPMVNFSTPEALGVGIARGAATRLESGDKTLDYSGRPLNLAARLMDIARPSGVVFDGSLGVELLKPDVSERFECTDVYVKGIAEAKTMPIWYSAGLTEVGPAYKQPIVSDKWHVQNETNITLKTLEERSAFLVRLAHHPIDVDHIEIVVSHPKVMPGGKKHASMWSMPQYKGDYIDDAGRAFVRIDYSKICTEMRERGVRGTWPVRTAIRYRI